MAYKFVSLDKNGETLASELYNTLTSTHKGSQTIQPSFEFKLQSRILRTTVHTPFYVSNHTIHTDIEISHSYTTQPNSNGESPAH